MAVGSKLVGIGARGALGLAAVLALSPVVEAQQPPARPLPVQENRGVGDVESAFFNLTLRGEWLGWRHRALAPMTPVPPLPGGTSKQHYQGIARSPRTGTPPIFYITRSGDVEDPENLGNLLVVRLASRNPDGERLRSNRLGPEETKNTLPPAFDEVIANVPFPDYQHPGGVQMVGDILAVPLETPRETGPDEPPLPPGRIVFFDCAVPHQPVEIPGITVDFPHNVGVIGLTRLPQPDGHFLLVATHGAGEVLEFFRSNGTDFLAPGFAFEPHDTLPASEVQGFWRTGATSPQNLNFVQQTDGRLFLVGSSNSMATAPYLNGEDHMFLYEVGGFGPGEQISLAQRDTVRHKTLRSKGNFVVDWEPLGDDLDLFFEAMCVPGLPLFQALCVLGNAALRGHVHNEFAKQEANFNASGGVYVSPTGELLYYSAEYYNLGPANSGRMAELRHRNVSRHSTCGPQFRPNHLGGPYEIAEGSRLELDGTVHTVEPWVHLFEHECFNCGRIGNSCTPGAGCDPDADSVMMDFADQFLDRYDDFKKLDGGGLLGANGFNDIASSLRFCGRPGTRLTVFDDDSYEEGDVDNLVIEGTGAVISVGAFGPFDDEATSARIDVVAPPARPGHHWDLDGDLVFECAPPDYAGCFARDQGRRVTLEAGCGSRSFLVRLDVDDRGTGTFVHVKNVAPSIHQLTAVHSPSLEAEAVRVTALWEDSCAGPHTAEVHWGDGTFDAFDLGEAKHGTLVADHVYGDDGPYTVEVRVSDGEATAAVQHVQPVLNRNPFSRIDTAGAVELGGRPVFLGRAGTPQTHRGSADDAGSDDLRFRWLALDESGVHDVAFGDTVHFNDGIAPDPPGSSAGVFPFAAVDEAAVVYPAPGWYLLQLRVSDDDGGNAADAFVPALVAGGDACTRSTGAWRREVEGRGGHPVPPDVLERYLRFTGHASGFFAERLPATTAAEAAVALRPGGAPVGDPHPSNRRGKAVSDLLAAWLNVASGAVDPLGPANPEDPAGETVLSALARVEAVLSDPGTTAEEVSAAAQTLALVNQRGCP